MKMIVTEFLGAEVQIQHVEHAINYWRARAGVGDGVSIAREVSVLADCYGLMIYTDVQTLPVEALAPAQRHALEQALRVIAKV